MKTKAMNNGRSEMRHRSALLKVMTKPTIYGWETQVVLVLTIAKVRRRAPTSPVGSGAVVW